MCRIPLSLSLLLIYIVTANAQPALDSLYLKLNDPSNQNNQLLVAETLLQIGGKYLGSRQYDSAAKYLHAAKNSAAHSQSLTLSGQASNNLGVLYNLIGKPDSAIYYYNLALQVYQHVGDTARTTRTKINLAIYYKDQELYPEALNLALDAALALEKEPPDKPLGSCYSTIAVLYARMKNVEQALLFHRKAIDIRRQINNPFGVAQSYNNMAILFADTHQYDSATKYYQLAMAIKRELNDPGEIASTLHNLGELALQQNQLREAEKYLLESLRLKKQTNDPSGIVRTLNTLGKLELHRNNNSQASNYLAEAEQLANTLQHLGQLHDNYKLQVEFHNKHRDYQKAFAYAQKLILVNDSLLNREKMNQLMHMRVRYAEERAQQQITLLEKDRSLQQTQLKLRQSWIIALTGAVFLFAIIGALSIRQANLIQKNKVHIETLLQELHHRVKNNLQIMSSMLMLQSAGLTDPRAIQTIKTTEGRVNAMALIHKKLYGQQPSRQLRLKEYLTDLVNEQAFSYGLQNVVTLKLDIPDIHLDVDKMIPLGLIVNEIVSNAFKHAFQNHDDPKLILEISTTDEQLNVVIKDNGKGMPAPATEQSFGLKLVNMLVREIKGVMQLKTEAGTTFTVTIPLT
jgi:two-component system, sensor histidine kinase PdtaS